jgi:PII-like signaling protein
MKLEGDGLLVRIFVGEADRYEGVPLYEAIVQCAREKGLAGATVLRGIEGFGAHNLIHSARVLQMAEDLPMVVEIDAMIAEGLVTLEPVQVILYRVRDQGNRHTH